MIRGIKKIKGYRQMLSYRWQSIRYLPFKSGWTIFGKPPVLRPLPVCKCMNTTPLLRLLGEGFVDIKNDLFNFLFSFPPLGKSIGCSVVCLILLRLYTCFYSLEVWNLHKCHHPQVNSRQRWISRKTHRECRWTYLLSCFKGTLTDALVSI
jgi:hypothetical protein